MGANEPVVLLQLSGLLHEHVLANKIEFLHVVHGHTVVTDNSGVNNIESTKVFLHSGPQQRVVVPLPRSNEVSG